MNNGLKRKTNNKVNYVSFDIDDELNDFLINDAKKSLRSKKHQIKYILNLYMINKKGNC